MATVTIITDDLTGLPGAETRRFEFQGNTYDIDLTDFGFDDMAQAFHYVNDILAAARPVHPSLVTPVAEPVAEAVELPYALKHTAPEYRARNAQIVRRFHSVLGRVKTKTRAAQIVGDENGLSYQRIFQIVGDLSLASAVEFLLTNP